MSACRVIKVEVEDSGEGTTVEITVARAPEGHVMLNREPPLDLVPPEMRDALAVWLGLIPKPVPR
jgi:hypothetical protein